MEKKLTKDLTKGNIVKAIVMFALPVFFGMLFQQLYNIFDTIIVGRALGVEALAGVGSTGSINFFVLGFCNGVASGCAIPIAQKFGAKDYDSLRKYVANCLYLGIGFVTILTTISCVLCSNILTWMNTLPEVFDYAYDYIFIIFLGIPVTFAYNLLGGIIRSLGDSKTPVIFLIIATLINIALDVLFMMVLKKGVMFAAIATIISQTISALLCFIFMIKKFDILKMQPGDFKISFSKIGKLLWIGLPMGLQYSITAIGSIILTGAVNSLNSTVYVASITAASKLSCFFCCPFDALGSTMATFGGQNVGAQKYDRLAKGMWTASLIGIAYSLVAFCILYLVGGRLSMVFIDSYNDEILEASQLMLTINSAFYILLVFVNVVRFTIQGMGYSVTAVIAGILEMIGRALIGIAFVPKFGYIAACFSSPVAWILADLFLIPTFYFYRNKLIKRQKKNECLN